MASIGYNQGYYSRSKYNNLSFQGRATLAGVSGGSATSVFVVDGSSTISGTSGFTSKGTQLDLGLSLIHI